MTLRRRIPIALVVLMLLAIAGRSAAAGSSHVAAPSRGHWLTNVTISEYWPVPESWFRGALVTAPGMPGRHRVDWLYSGTGLVMEGDGITLGGGRVHVDAFGTERWVNARGQRTQPTASGVWTHGDPAWRVGGWRSARGAVTFPLQSGGWSNGPGVRYSPVRGVRFARGPSLPLKPYQSVAVDPHLIPAGSRIYIAAYRRINGGWFIAQDTGSGIIGRHIDVYRLPPRTADDGRFLEHQRVLVVPPGHHSPAAESAPGRGRFTSLGRCRWTSCPYVGGLGGAPACNDSPRSGDDRRLRSAQRPADP